jgi:hypothetical protein
MPVTSHFPELPPADLHGRAEACRSLATTSNIADRKALWLDRAAYWEELAFEASARLVEALRPSALNKAPRKLPADICLSTPGTRPTVKPWSRRSE